MSILIFFNLPENERALEFGAKIKKMTNGNAIPEKSVEAAAQDAPATSYSTIDIYEKAAENIFLYSAKRLSIFFEDFRA